MKNSFCFIIIFLSLLINENQGQPLKLWNKSYGGNAGEYATDGLVIRDSLVLVVGRSGSTDLGSKGLDDAAICIINKQGQLKRIKTFGSPSNDIFNAVFQIPNGQIICAGNANGQGGDVSVQFGLLDGWILSYDAETNAKVWEKNFGGTNNDQINDAIYLEPGKIIFTGATRSTDRQLTANKGGFDLMVGTIDESGAVVRVRNAGGTKEDIGKKSFAVGNGDFWVAGETLSSEDGDFTGIKSKGGRDIFLMRFNRNSSLLVTKMLGSAGDDFLADMVRLSDGSFLLGINISGAGGDVDTSFGGKDILIVKCNALGDILWKKVLGGTGDDEISKFGLTSNEEIILMCSSTSLDGDFSKNYGERDLQIAKLDASGKLLWTQNYGGRRTETPGAMVLDSDNLIFTFSASFSIDRDLDPTNLNTPNFWILNLYECPLITSDYVKEICLGDTAIINGKSYFLGNDSGIDTLINKSFRGCDSIVQVKVFFNAPSTEFLRDTLCNNGFVTINNVRFDKNKREHVFNLKNQFGCDSNLIVNIHVTEPIAVKDTIIKNDNGSSNGSIMVSMIGGTAPYGYKWSNGFQSAQIINLTAGEYTLTVTDSRKCSEIFKFIVKSSVSTEDERNASVLIRQIKNRVFLESENLINQLIVKDVSGRMINTYSVENQKFEFTLESGPGIYLLTIIREGQIPYEYKILAH